MGNAAATGRSKKTFYILGDERIFLSKSPAMFNAVMKRVGYAGTYEPLSVPPEKIGEVVEGFRRSGIAGANVTIPHKEAVIPYLDTLSEGGNIIGAINTIVPSDDKLKGYNTNAIGFMDALGEADFHVAGKSALVFGNGGAAKAVLFILNWLGAESIYVVGRNYERTKKILNGIGGEVKTMDDILAAPLSVSLVVNASSVSSPEEAPEMAAQVEKLNLPDCELLVDLNYGRSRNFWHDLGSAKSIPFQDGLATLANQAKGTFALWTGIHVEPIEFLKALEEVS